MPVHKHLRGLRKIAAAPPMPQNHISLEASSSGSSRSTISAEESIGTYTSSQNDNQNQNERYPVGTIVKKYFSGHGWCRGEIFSASNGQYKVRYTPTDPSSPLEDGVYGACEMPRLLKTAAVTENSRLEIFWPREKRYYPATVRTERPRKRENFLISYDGGASVADREWIDLHRHKFRILSSPASIKGHPKEVVVAVAVDECDVSNIDDSAKKPLNWENNDNMDYDGDFDGKAASNAPQNADAKGVGKRESDVVSPETILASGGTRLKSRCKLNGRVASSTEIKKSSVSVVLDTPSESPSSSSIRSIVNASGRDIESPALQKSLYLQNSNNRDTVLSRIVSDESSQPEKNESQEKNGAEISESMLAEKQTSQADPIFSSAVNDPGDDGVVIDPINDKATRKVVMSLIGIGSRVSVYWDDDKRFYSGTVTDRRNRGEPFYLEYDDGEEEWIDLRLHKFRLLQVIDSPRKERRKSLDADGHPMDISDNSREAKWQLAPMESPMRREPVAVSKETACGKRKQPPVAKHPDARKNRKAALEALVVKKRKILSDCSDDDAVAQTIVATDKSNDSKANKATYDTSDVGIGTRLSIFWDGDRKFYSAIVRKIRNQSKSFFVEYDDGEAEEWIDLRHNEFKILPNAPPEKKKRGRPNKKEKICPDDLKKIGIGSRVAVYWTTAKQYFEGCVTKQRKDERPFYIEYDRGDSGGHWIDFARHTFRLLGKKGESEVKKPPLAKPVKRPEKLGKALSSSCKDVPVKRERKEIAERSNSAKKSTKVVKKEQENDLAGRDLDGGPVITVGSRVSVYWEGDSKYYEGVVTRERKTGNKRHYLEYDDGEAAHWIDFKEHWVRVVSEEPEKMTRKRKDNAAAASKVRKSKASRSCQTDDASKVVVGSRVTIWWAGEDKFHNASVTRAGKKPTRFYVKYDDDGEEEWVNFSRQAFRFLEEDSDVEETELPLEEDDASVSSAEDIAYDDFVYGEVDSIRVGSRISVWWSSEKRYFDCTLKDIDSSRKPYFIAYDDGDEEWTDLRRRYFRILDY